MSYEIKKDAWGGGSSSSSEGVSVNKKDFDPVFSKDHHEEEEEYELDSNGDIVKRTGINWFITGLCIVGDLAGGGLVALPTALIQTQFWLGIVLTVVMSFVLSFTAYCLGQCWVILLRMYPEYRTHCRKPYPEMGYRALGPIMRVIVSVFIDITLFGICVVFLLLASKNIHDFIKAFFDGNVSFCIVILFVSLFLLPVTFLKSPKDFWWAIVSAMITTSTAVVLIIIGSILDYDSCHKAKGMPGFHIQDYFLAFATITFAYGGHSAFPTIQHDMKKPAEFKKSTIMAFLIVLCMYTPTCIVGYLTYGDSLRDSVINSLQIKWIQQTVNICITLHVILTLTIIFNPINQEAEEIFRVPHKFGIRRVIVRLGVMLAVVFVAESVPQFGPLLDLVGGSTMSFTAILFPALFYLYLYTKEKVRNEYKTKGIEYDDGRPTISQIVKHMEKWKLICCIIVIVISIVGACAATYSAIKELSGTHFEAPCYIAPFLKHHDNTANSGGHTNCCGHYQNVSRYNDPSKCSKPDLDYYN